MGCSSSVIEQINDYSVIEALGKGNKVFRARNSNGDDVILRRYSAKPDQLDSYKKDASVISKCKDRNIVHIYDYFAHGDQEFIVVEEYCKKGELADYIGKIEDQSEKLQIMRGIAEGLSELHSKGVIHRDLTPENIVFDKDGTPKITGFDEAYVLQSGQNDVTSQVIGTVIYMAPEMTSRGGYSKKLDVWNLGLIFMEILIGERISDMFFGNAPMIYKSFPEGKTLERIKDEKLQELLSQMLQRRPSDRLEIDNVLEIMDFIQGGGQG